MDTHIVLIGFMGAGKTTVGRLLARLLQLPFIDLDHAIEFRTGRSIADIFARDGEAGFRALEAKALRLAVAQDAAVIAVGGGALERHDNVRALRRAGELVWLRAPISDMVTRAAQDGRRPLLSDRADAEALYQARVPVYSLADLVVDATDLNPEQVARAVHRRLSHRVKRPPVAEQTVAVDDVVVAEPETVVVDLEERSYKVHVGPGLLTRSGDLCTDMGLPETGLLVTNPQVGALYAAATVRALSKSGRRVPRMDIPDGEKYKTMASVSLIYEAATNHKLGRDSAFYALGGGVVGDVAGFAAATFLRGVDFVQVPTTLLAQVDSSVGGKTGVNLPQGKNLAGAFHQPRFVVADVDTLTTLPARELSAGLAEVVKYGVIRDGPLFGYLEDRQDRLYNFDRSALTKIVARSCQNKADVVQQDERETVGVRELLNFGHTVGHALEAVGGYTRWLHGEAVALGMVAAALLSRRFGGLSDGDVQRLVDLLRAYNLPVSPGPIDLDTFKAALLRDKKMRKGRQRFVLLRSLGSAFVSDEVTDQCMCEAIREQQTL